MQRPLARRDAIGMAGLDSEAAGAVLQQDASLVGNDRRAERMRDRVDERADVAVLVDHSDIDGRRIHRRRDVRQIKQPVHPDILDVLVGEFLREDAGDIDMNLLRVADILLAHHVGDARGFRLEMEALDAERGEFRQVEAGEDVEHHQHGDPRAVRRFGRMRGEIFQRVQAADTAQGFHHVGCDLAGIERVTAVLGDGPQRLAQFGLVDHVAGHRRLAMRQEIALGVGAVLQLLELVLPVEGDTGRNDIAFLGGLDRRLQQGVEPHLAVVAQDRVPGVDRAGNAHRMRGGQRHRGLNLRGRVGCGVVGEGGDAYRRAGEPVVGHRHDEGVPARDRRSGMGAGRAAAPSRRRPRRRRRSSARPPRAPRPPRPPARRAPC